MILLAQPSNDHEQDAIILTHQSDWCSSSTIYTNVGATADGTKGSRWQHDPFSNVWFKFQATSTEAAISINLGTIKFPMIALWDDAGNELASSGNNGQFVEVGFSTDQLIGGNWYYVSVDVRNNSSGNQGTFGLCIDTKVDYDFKTAAIELSDITSWCSSTDVFSTVQSTPDGVQGSRWQHDVYSNVWLKFQATSHHITIDLKRGTIKFPMIALWDETGNELASSGYNSQFEEVGIGYNQLVVGNWYYISVDTRNNNLSNRGTFGLCLDTSLTYDFREAAYELNDITNWSSASNAFSTKKSTLDGTRASRWQNDPFSDVWFKFQAQGNDITVDLIYGNTTEGDIIFPMLALWDESGNELASSGYNAQCDKLGLGSNQLIDGNWYYLSVDTRDNNLSNRGDFGLRVDNTLTYDFKEAAYEITDTNGWCSTIVDFDTETSSPDGPKGSNWQNDVFSNVWFRFQATSPNTTVDLITGSIVYPMMAIFDANDNEIVSTGYNSAPHDDLSLTSDQFQVGEWYYISVDTRNNTSNNRGTFGLCLSGELSFDLKEGAVELTEFTDWCSLPDAYSTANASPDGLRPSRWQNDPNSNVWFKFQAQSSKFEVQIIPGTIQFPMIALWDSSGNEIISNGYHDIADATGLSSNELNVGNWYYLSVDNRNNSVNNQGSFGICLDTTLSNDYKEGAIVLDDVTQWCSLENQFSNRKATPDEVKGSNWQNEPYANVWFNFRAINDTIDIELDPASINFPMMALWDASGNEIISRGHDNYGDSSIYMTTDQLTIGDEYYISVDTRNNEFSNLGNFRLCIDNKIEYNQIPDSVEFSVLKALYLDLDGDEWTNNEGWPTDSEFGNLDSASNTVFAQWYGITVEHGDITEINLPNNNLRGYTTASINQLTTLKKLILSNNDMGFVNFFIGNSIFQGLVNLEVLYLDSNQRINFMQLDSLKNLKKLNVSNNPLFFLTLDTGSQKKLIEINASNCFLNQFPDFSDYDGEYASDLSIDVSGNSIYFQSILPNLSAGSNVVDGFTYFPQKDFKIPSEYDFVFGYDIEINGILDTSGVVYEWFRAPDLESEGTSISVSSDPTYFKSNGVADDLGYYYLQLSHPDVSGCALKTTRIGVVELDEGLMPDSLEFLALKQFYETTNGDGWSNRSGWPSLSDFDTLNYYYNNLFRDWHGVNVTNGDVTGLTYSSNNLTGNLPEGIGELKELKNLVIFDSEIDGGIPPQLYNLNMLQTLVLYETNISGQVSEQLINLQNLEVLALGNSSFSGTLPQALNDLPVLSFLSIENNNFSGALPIDVGTQQYLILIDISNNSLSAIPNFSAYTHIYGSPLTLSVWNNKLDFSTLAPNLMPGSTIRDYLIYTPQKQNLEEIKKTLIVGSSYELNAAEDTEGNQYQWQKYEGGNWIDLAGETERTCLLNNFTENDLGKYRCEMTNIHVPGLTLYSDEYNINVYTKSLTSNKPVSGE